MADRHLAAETERLRAGADLLDIEEAHLARLVQVDVEPDTVPCRDRENAVELPFGVAVDLQRIDAADQIGAVANGRVEQVENARAAHHAALREGHDLHRHPVAIALAGGKHSLQLGEAAFEIDVDMGAQVRRAARDAFADQVAGAFFGRQRQVRQDRLVGLDAAHAGRARRVAHPRQAGQRLVEMHVAVDQPRQHEIAADVERRRAVRRCGCAFADNHDLPTGDTDIDKPTIGDAAVGQERLDHRSCPNPHEHFCRCGMLRFLETRADGLARAAGSMGGCMRDVIPAPVPGLDLGREYGHHQSPAIRAGGLIFCSGMVAINPETGEREHGTVTSEARRIFENLKLLLESAGSSLDRIVQVHAMIYDRIEYDVLNRVYRQYVPHAPPARTVMSVQIEAGFKVMLDVTAAA